MTRLTDDEIKAFRAELLADAWARHTDAPYLCARALAPATQRKKRDAARAQLTAMYASWVARRGEVL